MSMKYLVPFDDPRVGAFARVRPMGSARKVARWLVLLFLLLVVALALVPWQQTAYGEGQVVATSPTERQQPVAAPVEGWLQEWFVQEGSRVEEGDPIVRIADNDPLLLERLGAEREAALARQQAAEQALAAARSNVRRQRELNARGLSARKQLEEAQLKVADVLKELTAAQAELARLETRQARQSRQLVTAPRAGIILRRMAGEASVLVKPGDELAILVPEASERAVELWLDGNDVPLVRPGREVRLQFEGWPALQFSGWPTLAVGTFNGGVSVVDAAEAGRPGQFRVLVTPAPGAQWPEPPWLRQGVRAHGWVLLNEVPLGYELWRRFNDFPPEVPPGDKQAPGAQAGAKKEEAGSAADKDAGQKK